jgi:vacuolar-type H+-ATPase subunit I/STV1
LVCDPWGFFIGLRPHHPEDKEMSDIDLNSPEVKAAIQAAVDAAIKPLTDKRDELLGEVKKLRKESAIKPEDLEAVEKERDELKTQLATAQKESKTFKEAADKATKALESESGFTQKLLVENGLTEAFMKAGVTDQDYIDLLKSKHTGLAKVVIDGDNRKVMFGDKDMDTYLTEWKSTDAAKKFIAADGNSGGGSGGGDGKHKETKTGNMGGTKAERLAAIEANLASET